MDRLQSSVWPPHRRFGSVKKSLRAAGKDSARRRFRIFSRASFRGQSARCAAENPAERDFSDHERWNSGPSHSRKGMTTAGSVFAINTSPGGVPKLPVPEALITQYGLFGDSQRNRKFHGGRERAVCLFSIERIHTLQDEGHPISPGSTGENLTLSGIDWSIVSPRTLLEVGESLL